MTRKFAIRLLIRIFLSIIFWLFLEITEFKLSINLPTISPPIGSDRVAEIAQQVTVRIFTKDSAGSGVIIQQQPQNYTILYTVLTNRHVVEDSTGTDYHILTQDGAIHPAQWIHPEKFGNLDIALVKFSSSRSYPVVKLLENRQLWVGDLLYAAGFPNWQWHDETQTRINNTRDWGLKAFQLTTGRLAMQLDRPLEEGYQIGYTNEIESGMSGGPILNQHGYLVGINGRLKYPLGGIDTFKFTDGKFPRWSEFKQMERLSWGIPIETVLGFLDSEKPRNRVSFLPPTVNPTAVFFLTKPRSGEAFRYLD